MCLSFQFIPVVRLIHHFQRFDESKTNLTKSKHAKKKSKCDVMTQAPKSSLKRAQNRPKIYFDIHILDIKHEIFLFEVFVGKLISYFVILTSKGLGTSSDVHLSYLSILVSEPIMIFNRCLQ